MTEVVRSVKLYGSLTIMLILCIGVLLFLYAKQKENEFKNSFIKTYYQVIDTYNAIEEGMSEKTFFAQVDSLERLKQFNNSLHNSSDIDFIEFNTNHIEIMGYYDKPLNLVNGYGHKDLSNQRIVINGKEEFITPINSMQLSNKMFNGSNLDVYEGRNFELKDFEYDDDNIPILMGYEFLEYYNIGDKIDVNFFLKTWKATVVGFLEKGSQINMDSNSHLLDTYIITPYFNQINVDDLKDTGVYADVDSDYFIKSYYLAKNNGYLIFENKDDFKKYEKLIKQKAKAYDLDFILLRGY